MTLENNDVPAKWPKSKDHLNKTFLEVGISVI